MKCSLCSYVFNENENKGGCSSCHVFSTCDMIRCPNCGYETPPEPRFIKKIKQWSKKNAEK